MVKIVFGGASISKSARFNTVESGNKVLDILLAHNITNLDSARLYPGSEEAIGQLEKRNKFTIDTKWQGGFLPGEVTKEKVIANAKDSLQRAGIDQFDVFYIHAPDSTTPIEETLDGVNEAYKLGIFRRFGLSNFTAKQVEEAHAVASKNGWVLPTVYQGNYSPVARHLETLLFPTLAKLNINFYAYSPLAGGFLTKTAADLDAGAGRFNEKAIGGLYSKLYDSPALREALVKWNEIAEAEGVSKAELAYRWVAFHSKIAGDEGNGVIFGASRHEQIEQTAKGFERGKLSDKAVQGIEAIWNHVKDVAPIDNFNQFSHL